MEMYSLYQAWLHQFGSTTPSCLNFQNFNPLNLSSSAAQTVPIPTQQVQPGAPDVSIQVGPGMTHFSAHKSILSAHSGYFKAALTHYTGLEPISVPNVNVDEFSYLLTFMYTGFLDLNIRNIYNILLATHILHMPAALEICRTFLLHTQNLENRAAATTTVLKPIPSRKVLVPAQMIPPPSLINNSLPESEDTPFKKVRSDHAINKASTSKVSNEKDNVEKKIRIKKRNHGNGNTNGSSLNNNNNSGGAATTSSEQNSKVIIDVACCDGPVRFHKVINKNYGILDTSTSNTCNSDENSNQNGSGEMFTCLYCNHTFKSQYCYQKHARRHLNPVSAIDVAKNCTATSTSSDSATVGPPHKDSGVAPSVAVAAKREVKLLDMNVQYYPCKTCGSKFPSYYFVHKHRKMCHAEEILMENNEEQQHENNPSTSISVGAGEIKMNCNDSSSSASPQIDVETVNSDNNTRISTN